LEVLKLRLVEDLSLGLIPCFVNANFGATATGAIDPLESLAEFARQANVWFHVDGAYAGAVALVPELRPLLKGVEAADSFCVNGSKWMNVNFGCSFLFLRDVQAVEAAVGGPSCGAARHPKDLQLGLSKPFRSLKVFAALRTVGLDGIRTVIRRHVALAKYLDSRLRGHGLFECEMMPLFGLVVFRIRMADDDENRRICARLQQPPYAFFTSPVISRKILFIRVGLSHCALEYRDMDNLFEAIVACSTSK
jgi:glutamate/tyrosine decarboxylase-like PLP-dependent enzyme